MRNVKDEREHHRGRAALQGPRQSAKIGRALAPATLSARLYPASGNSVPIAVAFPEHGSGRASKIATCHHCGAKPLIVRKCGRNRQCAVCHHCGFHHRVRFQ